VQPPNGVPERLLLQPQTVTTPSCHVRRPVGTSWPRVASIDPAELDMYYK
jgi:hypothetical protein